MRHDLNQLYCFIHLWVMLNSVLSFYILSMHTLKEASVHSRDFEIEKTNPNSLE